MKLINECGLNTGYETVGFNCLRQNSAVLFSLNQFKHDISNSSCI